jgi:hypothetical protein
MRTRAPQLLAIAVMLLALQATGATQVTMRRTPEPIVTAENESWYLAGDAITYAGNIYYPTGPNVFFNPNEMVRSGDYQGVPLYVRTTFEPYSLVYVPLPGRVMKPYERRRSGDMAGTVGSTLPSFPVSHTPEEDDQALRQAAAPPTQIPQSFPDVIGRPPDFTSSPAPAPAATTGTTRPPGPMVSARKPEGLDGIFIEFLDRRWFVSGHAQELDPALFTRIGEYEGFAVYRKGEDQKTIYVAVSKTARELIAPYSARR